MMAPEEKNTHTIHSPDVWWYRTPFFFFFFLSSFQFRFLFKILNRGEEGLLLLLLRLVESPVVSVFTRRLIWIFWVFCRLIGNLPGTLVTRSDKKLNWRRRAFIVIAFYNVIHGRDESKRTPSVVLISVRKAFCLLLRKNIIRISSLFFLSGHFIKRASDQARFVV